MYTCARVAVTLYSTSIIGNLNPLHQPVLPLTEAECSPLSRKKSQAACASTRAVPFTCCARCPLLSLFTNTPLTPHRLQGVNARASHTITPVVDVPVTRRRRQFACDTLSSLTLGPMRVPVDGGCRARTHDTLTKAVACLGSPGRCRVFGCRRPEDIQPHHRAHR